MPLQVKYDDVTTYKVDAIVNSLGVYGNVYGKLCKNIITKAKDDELKAFIDKQNNPIGTVLVTGAGNLNCKNIIHVVTPFKKDDDENNSLLIKAYKDCLNKSLELGHKSIAMPFIGTGANGYSDAEAFEAIGLACEDVLAKEVDEDKDIINITVVGYLSKKNKNSQTEIRHYSCTDEEYIYGSIDEGVNEGINLCCLPYRYRNGILTEDFEIVKRNFLRNNPKCSSGIKQTFDNSINNFEDYIMDLSDINPNDLLIPQLHYSSPVYFYIDYMEQKGIKLSKLESVSFDRKKRFKMRSSGIIKKKDICCLSFVLGMNKTQILQWMFLAGFSFSPFVKFDVFFWKYINGYYGTIKLFYDFHQLCFNETQVDLMF